VIDIRNEKLISLSEAARSVPTKPSLATVWRWVSHGVRGCRLESVRIAGRRRTSVEALDRFISATGLGDV